MKRALLISLALWFALFGVLAMVRWGGPRAGVPDLPQDSEDRAVVAHRGQARWLGSVEEGTSRRAAPVSGSPATETPASETSTDTPQEEELLEEWIEEGCASDAELLERAGLSADTPLALASARFGPPDPRAVGEAELHLTLRDQASGEPVGGDVVLWRLNAPANVYWTAGDQDIERAQVPVRGHTFAQLVAGEYRVVVLDERASAPHHPPFHVSGVTAHEIFVEIPRDRPVRLIVDGLESAAPPVEARYAGVQRHPRGLVPPWVEWREIQPDFEDVMEEFESWEGDPLFPPASWIVLAPSPVGYDLGTLREDTRSSRVSQRVEVRIDGVERGEVVLRNPPSGPDPLESVTVRLDAE